MPVYDKAREFFSTVDVGLGKQYAYYWESVTPSDDLGAFQRYLFAFCSVHTSYQGNIRGYRAIRNYHQWAGKPERLLELLRDSGVGLHNNRTRYISTFAAQYWENPQSFRLHSKRNHSSERNRIAERISGLGLAKVSFALEMIHPNSANVVCGDIHQLRLYGMENCKYNSARERRQYQLMEKHWVAESRRLGLSPYVTRCMYWDRWQGKPDSRYWSFVLES